MQIDEHLLHFSGVTYKIPAIYDVVEILLFAQERGIIYSPEDLRGTISPLHVQRDLNTVPKCGS